LMISRDLVFQKCLTFSWTLVHFRNLSSYLPDF
jgi:hypothetical protein